MKSVGFSRSRFIKRAATHEDRFRLEVSVNGQVAAQLKAYQYLVGTSASAIVCSCLEELLPVKIKKLKESMDEETWQKLMAAWNADQRA